MELPKNITQIGEVNPHCKIYVEDYVISYIKQLNRQAGEKGLAVALYGRKEEEGEVTYLFLYGACRLNSLQRECRHLSQAVCQEAEKMRRKHFSEYEFLGYRLLDGEMIEGFHICEQGVCRYVGGYAQFYEKNDQMLALMLDERGEDARPEEVGQEKYDMVKKRQEERRALAEEKAGHAFWKKGPAQKSGQTQRAGYAQGPDPAGETKPASGARTAFWQKTAPEKPVPGKSPAAPLKSGKLAAAAVFAVLCVAGIASMGGGETFAQWRQTVRQLVEDMSEKQLPDAVEVSNGNAQVGTIVAEDKLTDAIQKENEHAGDLSSEGAPGTISDGAQTGEPENSAESPGESDSQESPVPGPADESQPADTEQPSEAQGTQNPEPEPDAQPSPEPATETEPPAQQATAPAEELVCYVVQRGDTLIGICLRQYGSDARVAEICSINNISNPDDIKVGEKIFLPQQ